MKPKYLIIHHTATPQSTTLASINAYHKDVRGFPKSKTSYYVGYHFLILEDKMVQTKLEDEVGAHCLGGYNFNSIGIALTGNFEYDLPTKSQEYHLKGILTILTSKYQIPKENILLHRDVWATACPGRNITKEYIYNLLMKTPMDLKENHLYQLVDPESSGGFGIAIDGKLIIDDTAKILATFQMRNDGNTIGKTIAVPTKTMWNTIPHYNLKMEVISI